MNLIISSYVCNPNKGSEDGKGWNYILAASKEHNVDVLTGEQNKADIEKYITDNKLNLNTVTFHYIPPMVNSSKALNGSLSSRVLFILWQYSAVKEANKIIATKKIDYVHHITWATCILPIQMFKVNAPLIYGPVGGGEKIPPIINPPLSMTDRITEFARLSLVRISRIFPANQKTVKKASIILSTTEETKSILGDTNSKRIRIMQAIGMREDQLKEDKTVRKYNGGTFHIMMSGRLLYWKGMDMGIEAVKKLLDGGSDVELTIVGDGKKMNFLKKISEGYEDRIHLVGRLPHDEMNKAYDNADCFVNCSYHDSGCIVVLEAMSRGCPVVCLDAGGPKILTTDACAIKIEPDKYENLVNAFVDAILLLMNNETVRENLISAGYQRVEEEFTYSQKYMHIFKLLKEVNEGLI